MTDNEEAHVLYGRQQEDGERADDGSGIVQNIASFLTLSDAASMASGFGADTPAADSWAVGTPLGPPVWSSVHTPPTPAMVSISPNLYEDFEEEDCDSVVDVMQENRRTWAQEKLAAAVFSHPLSLRSYCLEAYAAAKEVQDNQFLGDQCLEDESPETLVEPCLKRKPRRPKNDERMLIISDLVDQILHNVPLSVALDILEGMGDLSLDTSFAFVRITTMTVQGIVNTLVRFVMRIWDGVTHFKPLALFRMIVSHPFNAMGKTTEVFVSGIQSVATGVGSASSLAFHRLSARTASSSSLIGQQNALRRSRNSPSNALKKKLMKKLSRLDSAASVIAYTEIADDTGGLSRHAKSRVQRMMHYDVSLRPFMATVRLPVEDSFSGRASSSFRPERSESQEFDASSTSTSPSSGSPFMCTPQSFPPTPASRRMVLARGTRFADDVVFLARDQLRVHDALDSQNERTREMAEALTQGKRLAVFDADDASAGIDLTCGQHVATKVGNMLYCSSRSMVSSDCF
jgi:hypothetical protein